MTQEPPKGRGSGVKGRGYQQLLAWQRAHELAPAVFRVGASLSRSNGWLRSQCTRSSVSVAANIAEGYSRGSLREYIQFLNIARGFLAETEYHLLFMHDTGLIQANAYTELEPLVHETGNLLLGLIRSLRAKDTAGDREPQRIREEPGEYSALDPRPVTLDPKESA